MANGNGNNINTDDATADGGATATTATPQQQQHLTGDGIGACGDSKQPTAAATPRASNVNDLVADLWQNSSGPVSSRGDYTNIRATTTTVPPAAVTTNISAAGTATATSTFSFKHFLSSSGTVIAPTSTVTSLDATCSTNNSGISSTSATSTSSSLQTSTGARPKVPQSASVSHMQPDLNGSNAASKMKRSPRFSSFDSQASLAEYTACGSSGGTSSNCSSNRLRPDLRLEVDRSGVVLDDDDDDHVGLAQVRNSRLYNERVDDDIFPSAASNLHAPASNSRYVPRSYSSYDMPPPHAASVVMSNRRRPALRPNRLALASGPKMKLDLPLDTSNVSGAASALPDFVQDHLPDAWCQEAHLSSPPNSPLGAAELPNCGGAMGGGVLLLPGTVAAGLPSASSLSAPGDTAGSTGKMLPDFLSDGPILHSSQRLADVAIGLPSNSIDSPPQDDDGSTLHLSALRQQNERLQRELQETRVELNVQTRRADDIEQQLLAIAETRRRETLAAAANTQSTHRLRRQVAQLEAELFALRDGSDPTSSSGAAAVAAAAAAAMTPGSSHSSSSNLSRPSRSQVLARDLLRAADNAEQNLRQLLSGVDNLRLMAANLEQPSAPAGSPRSPNPDHYSDFH